MINFISEDQEADFSLETKIRKEKSVNLIFFKMQQFYHVVNDHMPQ